MYCHVMRKTVRAYNPPFLQGSVYIALCTVMICATEQALGQNKVHKIQISKGGEYETCPGGGRLEISCGGNLTEFREGGMSI